MTVPRLTIGLPVYNGARYLDDTVRSLLDQTYADFELLLADNSSTDGTDELCRHWAEKDARVRFFPSERNLGAAWNWNRTVDLARGELFRWCGYDDISSATLVERCVDLLDQHREAVLAYPRTVEIDADGLEIGNYDDDVELLDPAPHRRVRKLSRNLRRCNSLFGVVRTDVLRSTRMLGAYGFADRTYLLEMALRGRFVEVPERLFFRRIHDGQIPHTPEALAQFYDAGTRDRRWNLTFTQLFGEHIAAVARAPLPFVERVRCELAVLQEWQRWRAIPQELTAAGRFEVKALRGRASAALLHR